jgi:hypothetical protein
MSQDLRRGFGIAAKSAMPDQHLSLPDTCTEAGRIAAELASYQRGTDRDVRPAASTTTRTARRHVRRLAAFAAGRANAGHYADVALLKT